MDHDYCRRQVVQDGVKHDHNYCSMDSQEGWRSDMEKDVEMGFEESLISFKCVECNKSFTSNKSATDHMRHICQCHIIFATII